ncbi:MAG TPA: hypothetical protein DCX45_03450 [Acinetobacter junii]|nr:hypothetical protein [Acinetobacter junii]
MIDQRFDITLEYSDRVISKVLLADIYNPIDARTMWAEWNVFIKHKISIEGWQRTVGKIINAYQLLQEERAREGKPFSLLLSSSKGYYTSKNKEDAIEGLTFYDKRFEPMFLRRKMLKNLIKRKYEVNVDHPSQPGQQGLFL